MKIKTDCEYCKAKKSLLSVFTRDFYKDEDGFWNHRDKTAFYICKKCGYHAEFLLNRIKVNTGQFYAFFLRDQDISSTKKLDEKEKRTCIICEQSTKPPLPATKEIRHPDITKLYIKKPKKRFLGYFCAVCRRAYYLPIKSIKWEKNKDHFQKNKSVDLLNPLNSQLPEDIRKNHPKYNSRAGLIQDKRVLDCIGNFTTKGASFGESEKPMITVRIPLNKFKRTVNYLKKIGCEIVGSETQ